jgi:hypothetical protein
MEDETDCTRTIMYVYHSHVIVGIDWLLCACYWKKRRKPDPICLQKKDLRSTRLKHLETFVRFHAIRPDSSSSLSILQRCL